MEIQTAPPMPKETRRGIILLAIALFLGLPRTLLEWGNISAQANRLPNGLVILIASQLFSFAIVGTLIFFIYRRHNWARWGYTVLTVLGLPLSVYPLLLSLVTAPLSGGIGLLQVVLQIVGLVYLLKRVSSAWYKWRQPTGPLPAEPLAP